MGHFQNDLFSENQKDPFSGESQNDLFSAPIYKGEKGKRSNFTLKSSILGRRPFYFPRGGPNQRAYLSIIYYNIKKPECKAPFDERPADMKKIFLDIPFLPLLYIDKK